MTRSVLLRLVIAAAIALLVVALYWPGLSGGFVLDDLPNLNVLNQLPPQPTVSDYFYLAGTGLAGVLGRPIALLSFLMQHGSWPDPYAFKLGNLLIHLLNGLVLTLLLSLLARQRGAPYMPAFAIAAIVFIWLAHPMQVSTVLYVVQRMTQLSAFFTLLGIALYLWGRLLAQQERILGLPMMAAGAWGGAVLGALAKENGVLLLGYLAVLELTLLAADESSPMLRRARNYIVYLPLVLGALAFLLYLPSLLDGADAKPFDPLQRQLTQFPVLLAYLAAIALLRPEQFGLYHDDFPLVQGVFADPWVIPCLLLVLAALIWAWLFRRRSPLAAFAVLWFLTGHALEASMIPLELYFEHRNYLPLLGPVLALCLAISARLPVLQQPARRLGLAVSVLALLVMSSLTASQTRIWGDPLRHASYAVAQHPDSFMAQSNLVTALAMSGQVAEAYEFHLRTIDISPTAPVQLSRYLRWLEFGCLMPAIDLPQSTVLVDQAARSRLVYDAISILNSIILGQNQNRCSGVPRDSVRAVLDALLGNPIFAPRHPDLLQLAGMLEAGRGDFLQAAELGERSMALRPDPRVALFHATWLLRADQREAAVSAVRRLQAEHGDIIARSSDLTSRLQYLRSQL